MYVINQDQFDAIQDAYNNPPTGKPEADRYDAIYEIVKQPDAFGNEADGNVVAWFGAASQTNRGQGGASDFIRDYTQAQLEIRQGGEIVNIEEVLQEASNAISDAVWDDIEGSENIIDGDVYYSIPTALEIGRDDATQTLAVLSEFSDDPGIWSGNLLYLGLGEAEFYDEFIVRDSSDTYDLFVLQKAMWIAGLSPEILWEGGIFDLFDLFFEQGVDGAVDGGATATAAASRTAAFLQDAYGTYSFPAAGLRTIIDFGFSDFVVGSEGSETYFGPDISTVLNTDRQFVHGGGGDDIIYVSLGEDLIDGGDGVDTVVLASLPERVAEVWLGDTASDRPYSASVALSASPTVGFDGLSHLHSVERLVLGGGDDTVVFGFDTALEFIDAGGNTGTGDTADFTGLLGPVDVNLLTNSVTGVSTSLSGFENVLGTDAKDSIQGDGDKNLLDAGGGDDTVVGSAGDDVLDGGSHGSVGDVLDYSGAGGYIKIGTGSAQGLSGSVFSAEARNGAWKDNFANFEALQLSTGNDTLAVSSSSTAGQLADQGIVLRGGGGTDLIDVSDLSQRMEFKLGEGIFAARGGLEDAANAVGFEGAIGGSGNDRFWQQTGQTHFAGGAGADTFVIDTVPGDPVIIWGGGGADKYATTDSSPPDLAFVTVNGLNSRSFASLTPDQLLSSVDMSPRAFDAIIVNADRSDMIITDYNAGADDASSDTDDAGNPVNRLFSLVDVAPDGFLDYGSIVQERTADVEAEFGIEIKHHVRPPEDGQWDVPYDIWTQEFISEEFGQTYDLFGAFAINPAFDSYELPHLLREGYFDPSLPLTFNPDLPNYIYGPDFELVYAVVDWIFYGAELEGSNIVVTNSTRITAVTQANGDGSTYDDDSVAILSYETAKGGIDADLGGGPFDNGTVTVAGAGSDKVDSITSIVGSGFGDTITGSFLDETIDGSGGDDILAGRAGADLLAGGAGADSIDGGDGLDTLTFAAAAAFVSVDLQALIGLEGEAAGDTYVSIENVVGSAFGDTLLGDAVANELAGGAGNDTIDGDSGDDVIDGGDGDDILYGGLGRDTLYGGAGNDTVYAGKGYDTVFAGAGNDVVYGDSGRDTVELGDGDDVFIDNFQANQNGSDVVLGGAGNDRFVAGGAGDSFDGGEGVDTVDFSTAPETVEVSLADGSGSEGYAADDIYISIENVIGSAHADILIGDAEANQIEGGEGDDRIEGRAGTDSLVGGGGADTFAFLSGDGTDTISDFEDDLDLIDLSATGLSFADLTIGDDGSGGATVDYGLGDKITLTNVAGLIEETDFVFAVA